MLWPAQPCERALELDELRRFLRHPSAQFLRRQAGVVLDTSATSLAEREPLTLTPISQGRVDRALARQASTGGLDEARAVLGAQALLPPLDWGDEALQVTRRALEPGLHRMRAWQANHAPLQPRVFRLELAGERVLEGVLEGLHEDGFAAWVGNAHSASGWLQWWLGALVATALGHPGVCVAWGRDTDKVGWSLPWQPAMPDAAAARLLLSDLIDVYREGLREPLPLPPRTAFAWAAADAVGKGADAALKAANAAWDGGYNGYAEGGEAWFALAFRDRALFDGGDLQQRFVDLAGRVYGPLCHALAAGGAP